MEITALMLGIFAWAACAYIAKTIATEVTRIDSVLDDVNEKFRMAQDSRYMLSSELFEVHGKIGGLIFDIKAMDARLARAESYIDLDSKKEEARKERVKAHEQQLALRKERRRVNKAKHKQKMALQEAQKAHKG